MFIILMLSALALWWTVAGLIIVILFDFGQEAFNDNPAIGSTILFLYGPFGWLVLLIRNYKRIFNGG